MTSMRGVRGAALVGAGVLALGVARGDTPRVIVVHEGELLGSESRGLDAVRRALKRKYPDAEVTDATPAETEVARAAFAGKMPAPLPEWKRQTVVLAIEVNPPQVTKSGRIGKGTGSLAVFRPDALRPVYVEREDAALHAAARAQDGALTAFDESSAAWCMALLALGGLK